MTTIWQMEKKEDLFVTTTFSKRLQASQHVPYYLPKLLLQSEKEQSKYYTPFHIGRRCLLLPTAPTSALHIPTNIVPLGPLNL